ncbi:MAG TPA: CRTAC1 family protein [Candidatus Dormibacteraeota bacterium]|nr:CRTAC1 family protein [Candidatus Dormibacteraeota bacterium]
MGLLAATAFAQTAPSAPTDAAHEKNSTAIPIPYFEDIGQQAGLTVSHISSPAARYIIESVSGGVGLIDCDNDGKLDIITINGSTVDRYRQQGGDPMITLYHQGADLKFTDITKQAGLTRKGWGMGVAVADYDNDGLPDIYVTGYGGNVLYHNLGNCKFEDVTEKAGVGGGELSLGAAWGDYDRDGNVDLFVSRYVHVDMNKLPELGSNEKFCRFRGVLVQCGPWGMQGETDLLYHNRGDGTFEEVSRKAGVDNRNHYYGMGVVWGDYDNDGWPDLYVADDAGPNYLYRNKGNGTFEEVGLMLGADLSGDGQELGSMGVDMGDYDHDGKLDIFVTEFVDQSDTLYHNKGEDGFADVSLSSRIAPPSHPYVGWGTGFFDMDNSGWLDIFVANGHVYPQVDTIPDAAHFRQPMLLFRNHRDGTFEEVGTAAGLNNIPMQSRRGAAFGDIKNDGCVDIVTLNWGQLPSLLMNHCQNGNHRVLFKLLGSKSNRLAIGARVTVRAGGLTQFSEVKGGSSYLSQNDLRQHFGLGTKDSMDEVTVRWPSGQSEVLKNVPADFIYTIVEGQGIKDKVPLPAVKAAAAPARASESGATIGGAK